MKNCHEYNKRASPKKHSHTLSVANCSYGVCDVSTCTQLASCVFEKYRPRSRDAQPQQPQFFLPCGQTVNLRRLVFRVASLGQHDRYIQELSSLAAAPSLTHLDFHSWYPNNMLSEDTWPTAMPNLHSLGMFGDCFIAKELTGYSRLRHLKIEAFHTCTMLPEYFSALTQLETLSLSHIDSAEFPFPVLCLGQLRSLNLAGSLWKVNMPDEILCFAEWPHLTSLDLRHGRASSSFNPDVYSADARLRLLALCDEMSSGVLLI